MTGVQIEGKPHHVCFADTMKVVEEKMPSGRRKQITGIAYSSSMTDVVRLSLNLREAYFTPCEPFGSPLILLTVEGPTMPLSRGHFGFVALWCHAEECAFSLSNKHKTTSWTSFSTSESNRRTA